MSWQICFIFISLSQSFPYNLFPHIKHWAIWSACTKTKWKCSFSTLLYNIIYTTLNSIQPKQFWICNYLQWTIDNVNACSLWLHDTMYDLHTDSVVFTTPQRNKWLWKFVSRTWWLCVFSKICLWLWIFQLWWIDWAVIWSEVSSPGSFHSLELFVLCALALIRLGYL